MWRIPLSDLNYSEAEEHAVTAVLRSRWLSMGPRTEEFEDAAARYLGVKHAIAVANCTCALQLAYEYVARSRAFPPDIKPVFVIPNITFVATANAAVAAGGRVILTDLARLDQPGMRPEAASTTLSQLGSSIAAFVVMHYAGFDCGVEQIGSIADEQGIPVIEDAAHAIGGRTAEGLPLGTAGFIGCYSFFANKNLATGEGGLVVTNDDDAARAIRLGRSHGMTSLTHQRHVTKTFGYDVEVVGHNFRCTEIVAALAIEQLKKLDEGNDRRRQLYRRYCEAFATVPEHLLPLFGDEARIASSACHIYPLLCRGMALRDSIRNSLTAEGIQSSHHYPPLHTFSAYRELLARGGTGFPIPKLEALGDSFPADLSCRGEHFPYAASLHFASREITLPLHPGLSNDQCDEIIGVVLKTCSSSRT